jgi:pimeloyl-ACP methyl ester carboxylesterase
MQLVVDSLLTNYRRYGQGNRRAVLILHGWGDSSQGWAEFAQALADKYEVVCLDLPGFGQTQRPAEPWGLDDYAGYVSAFLKKADIKPYAIVSHSNGGAIAIRGLANGALTAKKLVLLSSAGVRSEYKGRTKAIRMVAKAGKLLATPLPEAVKKRMRRKLYTTVGSDMLVVENLQETFKRVVNDDVQQDAARLKLPTLLVYGDQDVSTPPEFGRLLYSKLTDSRLEILPGAEHFVHQDQPQEVRRLVREFLA